MTRPTFGQHHHDTQRVIVFDKYKETLVTITAALRRTRSRSGRSLSWVAARAGIAESNLSTIEHGRREPRAATIDRLAAALDVTFVPVATGGRSTTAEAADHVAAALAAGDTDTAYRAIVQVADDLASASPYLRALLAAEAPVAIDAGWNAFLAGVVEWRLTQAGLPTPEWIRAQVRDPAVPWAPPSTILPARPDHVPEPLRRRGIQVEADELTST
jgi:transcriptional regulator with XRE-family HTH domain